MRIAEIFTSIQGEGIWIGVPSIFVRVSGCNLRCGWCDTPYASWNPEGPTVSVEAILTELAANPVSHVVVTGGEPMLFDPVIELCEGLKGFGKTITIETAGTIYRDLPCDLMSISPKLANSTPNDPAWNERHEKTRFQPEVLRRLVQAYRHQLKFVVNPEESLPAQWDEIHDVLEAIGAKRENVLIMAEGIDVETLTRRERLLVEPCVAEGFRLTPRYHVHLFGNTRGT